MFLGRHDAVAAIIETAARQIGVGHTDAHHLLLASAGVASLHDPSTRDLIDRYAIAARNIDTTPGIGGRALDSFLAMLDTLRGTNPEDALERARRALSGGILGERTNFGEAWGVSCIVLMSRALGEVASHVDVAVTKARETGSAITMALAVMVRGRRCSGVVS